MAERQHQKTKIELIMTVPKGTITSDDAAAWQDVIHESLRQRIEEKFSTEHDDMHVRGELAAAAQCYAAFARAAEHSSAHNEPPAMWPFAEEWWKPENAERALIKSAALAIAEIQRIRRASLRKAGA